MSIMDWRLRTTWIRCARRWKVDSIASNAYQKVCCSVLCLLHCCLSWSLRDLVAGKKCIRICNRILCGLYNHNKSHANRLQSDGAQLFFYFSSVGSRKYRDLRLDSIIYILVTICIIIYLAYALGSPSRSKHTYM